MAATACQALFPEGKREEMLEDLLLKLPAEASELFGIMAPAMIERRLTFFGENTRLIADYQLGGKGDSIHLSVSSTLPVSTKGLR